MLNRAPIFINGFQRGGTNILTNLLASHPDVGKLNGETHTVFYGGNRSPKISKWGRRALCLPVILTTRQHTFWLNRFEQRRTLPQFLHAYIDLLFFLSKMSQPENKYRDEKEQNTRREIARTRLLAKNVNGVVLTTPILADIYPDATFIALVRNGLAICEGFVRRGTPADKIGRAYQSVCQQMIEDAKRLDNYYIVRFEDLLADPFNFIRRVYSNANLDINCVTRLRLQAKKSMTKDGTREYTFKGRQDREIFWFAAHEIDSQLRKDVNENQIARLNDEDRTTFLKYTQGIMEHFGYLC